MSKTTITKAIEEFEWAGEQFERNKDAARTKKVRLAATLMDTSARTITTYVQVLR